MAVATKIQCDICGEEQPQFTELGGPEERGWAKLTKGQNSRDVCPVCFHQITTR